MKLLFKLRRKFIWNNVRYLSNRSKQPSIQTKQENCDISFCIIGNGSEGNPRSVILDYSERLYMFNCGEGVQRILSDFGYKSSKIKHFFLTSNSWDNVSGLSSLLLARLDAGINEFTISGLNTETIVQECIRFDTKLKRVKFNHVKNVEFEMNRLQLKPIIIDTASHLKTTVYLGKILSESGRISLEKCFHQRVPRHLVSKLQKGESIILENGTIIKPEDVMDPDQPSKRFILFENNDSILLNNLERTPIIRDFLSKCNCMIHFTRDQFLEQSEYKSFLNKYESSYHLLLTESNSSLCNHSAHRFQLQLNLVDQQLFPILKEQIVTNNPITGDNKNIIHCQAGMRYQLVPHVNDQEQLISFDRLPEFDLTNQRNSLIHKDGTTRPGIDESLESLQKKQKELPINNGPEYPEFIFLGTASSVSLAIRNVPSILVRLSPKDSILLDCGESTYSQLLRFYGKEEIREIMNSLKLIFISHHHSDHHMGFVELVDKHYQFTNQKLFAILPPMVSKFLHSKSHCFDSLHNLQNKYEYSVNRYFDFKKTPLLQKRLPTIQKLTLIPVSHCVSAYGISIQTDSGFRFVYSGDTEPCDSLVENGKDCDLLIHESTVEDGLQHFARTHFHSTMSEAIEVGRLMNARFTILTHFSQRYGKLPFITERQRIKLETDKSYGLAFDNMKINAKQFERLPLMYDTLRCMYAKHLDNMEYRSQMYKRKYDNGKRY